MSHKPFAHLSYLGYQQFLPAPPLRTHVECYWVIRRDSVLHAAREEFLHPNGATGIMFHLADAPTYDGKGGGHAAVVNGPQTTTTRLGLRGAIETIGLRFHPGGAYPLLGMPLHELAEARAALGDVAVRAQVREVHERLYHAASVAERIELLDRWLLERLAQQADRTGVVERSLDAILRGGGQSPIRQVAADLHISERQLERLYKTWVGISPKKYARLVRVEEARALMKRNARALSTPSLDRVEEKKLVDIGYATGFFDQSHFIREFRSIEGITPQQYWQNIFRRYAGEPPP